MNQAYTERKIIGYDTQTGQPIYEMAPQPRPVIHVIFAWLSLLAGYAFCRVFPVGDHPFGGLLLIAGLFAAAMILLKCKGANFGMMPVLMSVSALAITPALFLSANGMIHGLVYLYALAVWCYLIYGASGNLLQPGFSDLLPLDFLKALFIMPFTSLGKLFPALFSGKGRGSGKSVLKIMLGIGIAVIPTVVVFALLSYDKNFVELYTKLFDFGFDDVISHLFSILFGIPIGMYFFGLFYAADQRKCADTLTAESCRRASASIKLLPGISAVAATAPILLVYGVFFASQWEYYLSAFTGVLPDETTFAEYAREGFFQLCAVSVINLIIIVMLQLFVRRKEEAPSVLVRILSVVFSCTTLVLIATAFSKLYLYIERFGLTPKRVYAGWFMGMLAVIFLLTLVKQLLLRFKLLPTAALVCVALFGVLALSGSDTRIAEYNVDRYLDGSLETVDVSAMYDLGDAAVPSMVRLGEKLALQNGTDLSKYHYDEYEGLYNDVCYYLYGEADRAPYTLFSFTLPRARAEAALEEAGIEGDSFEENVDSF